tara:strand:- start:569 stop:1801 length:1233 start_codon:yes stop_codon:yes gene_type:complete
MKKMEEKVNMEIAKAAEVLGMQVSETETKYMEICEANNLQPEEDWALALSLFRQWFSGTFAYKDAPKQQSSGNSLVKKASGYFISLDAPRDMAKMQNERIKNEYLRDADTTFSLGKVAVVLESNGGYEISRMHKGDEQTKIVVELPSNSHEIEVGKWIVPLDSIQQYSSGPNANYGRPLPSEQFRLAGVFIGSVDGNEGLYYFSYKGDGCKTFNPQTFHFVHFDCIPDSNNADRIYGFKMGTMESLVYNADLSDDDPLRTENPSVTDIQNHMMETAGGHYCSLSDIARHHAESEGKPYAQRFVITDGSVSSVNMTPNSIGTRRITVSDLNSDFDYDGGSWAGTTCWIPANIDIDFGIGSSLVLVGRTSQGRNQDGGPGDITINVSGVLCTENRGVVAEPYESTEEDIDWF